MYPATLSPLRGLDVTDLSDPNYGRGVHTIATPANGDEAAATALGRKLREVFSSPSYSPPHLPGVAMQILELSRRTEVTVGEIVELLQSDPMLAGRVLRIVQSPIYAGRSPITSLRQAVIRLGLNTMRDVVLEDAMNMKMFRSKVYGDWMESVRRHSVLTGHCARAVAKASNVPGEYAFMCGLLHDIGMAATLIVLSDDPDAPPAGTVARAMQRTHESASGKMAKLWKLPADIIDVIGSHHHIERSKSNTLLTATTCLAEELATRAGAPALGNMDIDRTSAEGLLAAKDALKINSAMWARLLTSAEDTRELLGL